MKERRSKILSPRVFAKKLISGLSKTDSGERKAFLDEMRAGFAEVESRAKGSVEGDKSATDSEDQDEGDGPVASDALS